MKRLPDYFVNRQKPLALVGTAFLPSAVLASCGALNALKLSFPHDSAIGNLGGGGPIPQMAAALAEPSAERSSLLPNIGQFSPIVRQIIRFRFESPIALDSNQSLLGKAFAFTPHAVLRIQY